MPATDPVHEAVNAIYLSDSRRVLATLIRLLGDFDKAEEALQDAFRAALDQWPRDGVPSNPRAWLVSAGRFKAIDNMRRQARFDALEDVGERADIAVEDHAAWTADESVEDDQLRLIFTCCHPALAPDAQIALTLREVCGLTTEEIARAFLTPAPTLAQRIVRAKAKIRDARIPYQVPTPAELPERLDAVLRVIYLVFNEGYAASSGSSLTRHDLSSEAIRLGRLLIELLPEPEAIGLLALMLLHESRRTARTSPSGELILLEDQDRSLWNREQIAEGARLVERALSSRQAGPYAIQAAIAAVHADAPDRGGDGLGGNRRALRCPVTGRSIAGHRVEPRGGGCHARWSGGGSGRSSRPSSIAAIYRTIGSRTPPGPSSAGGWGGRRRRGTHSNARYR